MDSLPPRRAELALIGAGPHALSVLLGLLTDERQFLTDRESQRAERRAEVLRRPTRGRLTPDDLRGRVLVVDEHGEFCAQWRSYFAALEIDFLRSTAIMHPDPSHPDALLEHAFRRGTLATDLVSKNELFEGRTGAMARKSSAINAREIDHYALPSSRLFDSFISERVRSFDLDQLVVRARCTRISVAGAGGPEGEGRHVLELSTGERLITSAVVMCLGPSTAPRFAVPQPLPTGFNSHAHTGEPPSQVVLHSSELAKLVWARVQLTRGNADAGGIALQKPHTAAALSPSAQLVLRRMERERGSVRAETEFAAAGVLLRRALYRGRRVLIVGGGQSAANLAYSAVRSQASQVTLCSRSPIRTSHFDVPLPWVGRHRNAHRFAFFDLKLEDRPAALRSLRPGGSVSPELMRALRDCESKGLLHLLVAPSLCVTTIHVVLPRGQLPHSTPHPSARPPALLEAHEVVIYATGCNINPCLLPSAETCSSPTAADSGCAEAPQPAPLPRTATLLAQVFAQCSIPTIDGFPALQDSLEWAPGSRIFVTGAAASMVLGPDSLNLVGGRAAADRLREPLLHILARYSSRARAWSEVGGARGSRRPPPSRAEARDGHAAELTSATPVPSPKLRADSDDLPPACLDGRGCGRGAKATDSCLDEWEQLTLGNTFAALGESDAESDSDSELDGEGGWE